MHNDYLLALDKIEIKKEMSKYQLMILDYYNSPINVKKLMVNLFDKEKYVLHYKNLQYIRLGLKLKKQRVLEFNQSQWLKPYV